jgi:hypothetical protein
MGSWRSNLRLYEAFVNNEWLSIEAIENLVDKF